MSAAWRTLLGAFTVGGGYSLLGAAVPQLQSFPVFSWVGLPGVTAWGWELALSPGYIGQGEPGLLLDGSFEAVLLCLPTVDLVVS